MWGEIAKSVATSAAKGAAEAGVSMLAGGGGGSGGGGSNVNVSVPNVMGGSTPFAQNDPGGKGFTQKAENSRERGEEGLLFHNEEKGDDPYYLMKQWDEVFKEGND